VLICGSSSCVGVNDGIGINVKLCLLFISPLAYLTVSGSAAPAPADPVAGPTVTGFAPLDYFEDNCARCHGDYGAFYGPTFGAGMSDKDLRQAVDDMATGPGEAPLKPSELDIETAWHCSVRDHKPFASVTAWTGGHLTGDASPGATITLTDGKNTWNVDLEDHSFDVAPGDGVDWSHAVLHVVKNKVETDLALNGSGYAPNRNKP